MNRDIGNTIGACDTKAKIVYKALVLVLVFLMAAAILPTKPALAQTVCLQVDGEGLADGVPIPGWNLIFGGPPAIASVTATSNSIGIHSGDRGVRVNGDYASGKEFDVVAKGIVTVDYWHYPKPGTSTNSMFQLYGGNYPDHWIYLTLWKNDQDLWWINDEGAPHPSVASYSDQYTRIVITIDTNTGLFDVNIDESFVHQGTVKNADKIGLSGIRYVAVHSGRGGRGTDSYFDDILITATQNAVTPIQSTPEVDYPDQYSNNPFVSIKETKITKGQIATVDILIRNIEQGLSGYDLFVSLPGEELIKIVDVVFPDFGLTDIGILTNSTTRVRAADLNDIIHSRTKEASLVTLKLQGVKLGTSELYVAIHAMDDDNGNAMDYETVPGIIEVVWTQSTSKEVPVPLPPTPSPVPDSPVSPSPPSALEPEPTPTPSPKPMPTPTPALIERGTTLWLWIVIASVITSLVVTIGWRLRRRASVTFTTQALSTRMGISTKKLRSFIKAEYPGELRGKKWYISSDLAKKVEKSYKAKIKARKVPPLNGSPDCFTTQQQ